MRNDFSPWRFINRNNKSKKRKYFDDSDLWSCDCLLLEIFFFKQQAEVFH